MLMKVLLQFLKLCLDLILSELAYHLYCPEALLCDLEFISFLLCWASFSLNFYALIDTSTIFLSHFLLGGWHSDGAGCIHETRLAKSVPWTTPCTLIVIELLIIYHNRVISCKVASVVLCLIESLFVTLLT